MNDLNGSEYVPGTISLSPDALEHIVEYFGGGLYRFVTRTGDVADANLDGREVDARNRPFVTAFRGENRYIEDQSAFYDRMDDIQQYVKQRNEYKGEERQEFIKENKPILMLDGIRKSSEKKMRVLRKKRDRIETDKNLTDAERDAQLKELQAEMKAVMDAFNKRFNEAMDGASP